MGEPIQIKNKQGEVRLTGRKYEGILWPTMVQDPVKHLDDTKNFPYQDGDVFVCSYPRTGSNWMLDMLYMLRSNTTATNTVMTPPVEIFAAVSHAKTPPRSLLTHLPYRLLPEAHVKMGGKMILMCRNPKDTAVSTFRFAQKANPNPYTGDFEEFLQYFIAGDVYFSGYVQYFQEWDKTLKANPNLPVLIVQYEELKKDCVGQLRKVCQFLEIDRTDAFLQEVADKNDIKAVKAVKEQNPELKPFIQATSTDGTLHFYRKGIVGDWQTHFTEAQSEEFDKIFKEQLKDTVFNYD